MHEGIFTQLEDQDCRDLLRTHGVGRVAWASPAHGIMVLPVNYIFSEGRILFRTSNDAVLAELVEAQSASLQVDDIDVGTGNGWSVLAVGETAGVPTGALTEAEQSDLPQPWLEGHRDLVITLVPTSFSGRVVDRSDT